MRVLKNQKNKPRGRMIRGLLCLLGVFLFLACQMEPSSQSNPSLHELNPRKARNEGTWYQIFTHSFYDSNGDGYGDLRGIAQKLDYLNDSNTWQHKQILARGEICTGSLHIDGIWLTPIMPSPSYHKYDTTDYKGIDSHFGTLDDFQYLLKKCHEHDIKLIIDLVMNHSSKDHPWFKKALEEVRSGHPGRYASYYNFFYGATPPENYKVDPEGPHTGSYYKFWGKAADYAWYEGSFWTGMPDLNWDSQALRKEFKEVVEFWFSAGLDGFRLDATSWLYNALGMERYNEGVHAENKNIEIWNWFNNLCLQTNPKVFLIGECWEGEDTIANYYNSGMNFFGFQFSTMNGGGGSIRWGAQGHGHDVAKALYYWDRKIKIRNSTAISAPFLSNHDQDRSSCFLMDDERKMAAAILLLSPGAPFIYYGEEIGLTSPTGYKYPDSNRRGPMYWSRSSTAGRTDPPPEWNWWQMGPASGEGVTEQLENPKSLLRYYIRANNLKNYYPFLAHGILENPREFQDNTDPGVAAFRVINPDNPSQSIIVTHNTNYGEYKDITYLLNNLSGKVKSWRGFGVHGWPQDEEFAGGNYGGSFSLPPYSTVVFSEYEE